MDGWWIDGKVERVFYREFHSGYNQTARGFKILHIICSCYLATQIKETGYLVLLSVSVLHTSILETIENYAK
jgi:hypothetical protein